MYKRYTRPSKNARNQVKGLHQKKLGRKGGEYAIDWIGKKLISTNNQPWGYCTSKQFYSEAANVEAWGARS